MQVAVVRADDFDLVAWTPAEAYRIEVKTAGKRSKQKTNQYHFDTRSGRTRRPMSGCDVVEFCALDIRMVVFRALAAVPTTSTLVPAQSFSNMNFSDLIPVLGMIASVIAAAAVARHQIRKLEIEADKSADRIDALDIRVDKLTSATKVLDRQVATLANINSPENLEMRTRRMESIRVDVEWIKRKLESI